MKLDADVIRQLYMIQKTQGYVVAGTTYPVSDSKPWPEKYRGLSYEIIGEATTEEWIKQGIHFYGNMVGLVTPEDLKGRPIRKIVLQFEGIEGIEELVLPQLPQTTESPDSLESPALNIQGGE